MATNLVFNAIAPETLKDDNYSNWSVCVKNYLLGQDLWDIIETVRKPFENAVSYNSWKKKNAMALHAIQISCGPDMLFKIRKIKIAKVAWDTLAKMHEPQTQKVSEPGSSSGNDDYAKYSSLLDALETGDWDAIEDYLYSNQNEYPLEAKLSSDGFTILHFAVRNGHVKIVEKLVHLMSQKSLKSLEARGKNKGSTALHYAIVLGFDEMVTCMVESHSGLLSITTKKGELPVVSACCCSNEHMTRYLYHKTPPEHFISQNGVNGAALLCYCFTSKMIDITLHLLGMYPSLALAKDFDGNSLMGLLSRMPSAFPSGSRLVFWQRWIYSCMHVPSDIGMRVPPTPPASNEIRVDISTQNQRQTNQRSIIPQVFGQLRRLLSYLLKLLGIKQIYDTKLFHAQADELLRVICSQIRTSNSKQIQEFGVIDALFRAVKHGIVEFFMEIIRVNPHKLLVQRDANGRYMFHCAIVYRQEKILSLVYGIHSVRAALTTSLDQFGNNMLHLAGMLAPSTRLDRVPGAALQMQRELQWFKEVENIVPSTGKARLGKNGHTPRELFTKEHRELVIEGQKWMKETSTSCAFVAALIVTIMFTAAFTIPGGNNQDTGFPMLLDNKLFKVFILCDTISFLSATTSILIFLGILTSRYAEEDFLKSLPTKMILGLTTLFISIATMIVAFCATLSLMLQGQMWGTFILVLVLASMPIIVFALLQFPLLVEISISTYGRSIFDRKTKSWYK